MSHKNIANEDQDDFDQRRFNQCLFQAFHKFEEPPGWFREVFFPGMLARLAADYGLPPGSLDHLPHALHLSLTTAPTVQPKEARKDLEKLGSLLEEARAIVGCLQDQHLKGLRQEAVSEEQLPDGSVLIETYDPLGRGQASR